MMRLKWTGEDQNLCIGIIREFDACHWLNDYKGKCANLHGHTWKVECLIKGQPPGLNKQGMVIDFGIVKEALDRILATMDHNIINFSIDQPTAENIAIFIYDQMYHWLRDYSTNKIGIPYFLEKVVVYETKNNFFEYKTVTRNYDIKQALANKRKEYTEQISSRMIRHNPMHDRKNVERMIQSLRKAIKVKPNKAESLLMTIFERYGLDYKYVGDFSLLIDGKNPDFVNMERKEIIDLFGRFWHSDDNDWYNTKNDMEERIAFFEERGWKILIVWDDELDYPETLVRKITEWRNR